jgi:adenosylcobinamide-phosphate synthase
MVGYKSERYRHIGWASAKLDDAVNFLPARLSGVMIVFSALLLGKRWKNSLRLLRRDHGKHESPNSAWPEAAMSGVLGVQLGGWNYYLGQPIEKPFIGERQKELDLEDIREAWKILYLASLGMLLFSILLAWAVGDYFYWR